MALAPLQRETADLMRLADRDLSHLWRLIADGASAEIALRDLLPAIITEYGLLGAALAAAWYDDQRAKAGTRGRFTATPVQAKDRGTQALVGWALKTASNDDDLKTLVSGGVQRRVTDHVRHTVAGNSVTDPGGRGWKRIGAGACDFCRMLIDRDELYSEATADFASHDHCNCQAYPILKGAEPIDVKKWTGPRPNITDADRARVREYLATH